MNIYVLSDTHNSLFFSDFLRLAPSADMIIHCGDGKREAEMLKNYVSCPVYFVGGNCDISGKSEEIIEVEGHRIFATHGHRYDVKYSLSLLEQAAERNNADIVLYGHTHIPQTDFSGGRWYINPGSLCRPRDGYKQTYCILHLTKDRVYPEMAEF